jgi:hypothetical protein
MCIGLEREAVSAGRKVSQATVELTSLDPGDTHRELLLEAQAGQEGKPDRVAHAEPTNRGAQFIVWSIPSHRRISSIYSIVIVFMETVLCFWWCGPS